MKLHKAYLPIAAAIVAGAVLLGRSSAQPQPTAQLPAATVAVCDVAEVFDGYTRGKQLSADFSRRGERLNVEDEERAKAIQDIESELQGLVPGSEAYESRLKEAQRLTIDREVWRRMQAAQVDRERISLTRDMYNEILAAVKKIATKKGANVVLYEKGRQEQATTLAELLQQVELEKVLYSDDAIDITSDVLTELNTAYEGSALR
jgi:Skp family chaperone for outer membrane proteins